MKETRDLNGTRKLDKERQDGEREREREMSYGSDKSLERRY